MVFQRLANQIFIYSNMSFATIQASLVPYIEMSIEHKLTLPILPFWVVLKHFMQSYAYVSRT